MNSIARCASKQVEKYLFFITVFPVLLLTAVVGKIHSKRHLCVSSWTPPPLQYPCMGLMLNRNSPCGVGEGTLSAHRADQGALLDWCSCVPVPPQAMELPLGLQSRDRQQQINPPDLLLQQLWIRALSLTPCVPACPTEEPGSRACLQSVTQCQHEHGQYLSSPLWRVQSLLCPCAPVPVSPGRRAGALCRRGPWQLWWSGPSAGIPLEAGHSVGERGMERTGDSFTHCSKPQLSVVGF